MVYGTARGTNPNQKKIFGRINENYVGPQKAGVTSPDGTMPISDFDGVSDEGYQSLSRPEGIRDKQWTEMVNTKIQEMAHNADGPSVLAMSNQDFVGHESKIHMHPDVTLAISSVDDGSAIIKAEDDMALKISAYSPGQLNIKAGSSGEATVDIETYNDVGFVKNHMSSLVVVEGEDARVFGYEKSNIHCKDGARMNLFDESRGYAIDPGSVLASGDSICRLENEKPDKNLHRDTNLLAVGRATVVAVDIDKPRQSLSAEDDANVYLIGSSRCNEAKGNSIVHLYDSSTVNFVRDHAMVTSVTPKEHAKDSTWSMVNPGAYHERNADSPYYNQDIPDFWAPR